MSRLVDCFGSENEDVQFNVLNILNEICHHIYPYIPEYLQKIGDLSSALIRTDGFEGVATMALEFWSGLCYIEQDNDPSKTINIIK